MQEEAGVARKGGFIDTLDSFSYRQVFLLWISAVVCFAAAYTWLSYIPGHGPTPVDGQTILSRFLTSIYYSVITATNTGYGDIVPHGASRGIATLEAFTGLFLFAFFMAKLVSRYQDVAIRQMHTISFQRTFHNMREDFFVVRRDFDHVMHVLEKGQGLESDTWERLTVAYKLMAGLLYEIPDFYDYTFELYVIDARREELLTEALQRTLQRLQKMLDIVEAHDIAWQDEKESMEALRDLCDALDLFLPQIRQKSRPNNIAKLERMSDISKSLRARLSQVAA